MKTTIKTSKGEIYAELLKENDFLQLNVFHVPKGNVGFFLMFPINKYKNMMKAARALIESDEQLPPDTDISSMVKGCLLAGAAPQPKVAFGTPSITYKEVQHGI